MSRGSDGKLKFRLLHFSGISVRPLHPRSGLEAPAAFAKTSPAGQRAAISRELAGRPVEIWFKTKPPFALPQRFALWNLWRIPPMGKSSPGNM